MRTQPTLSLCLTLALATSCATPPDAPDPRVTRWGTLREALRDGEDRARVTLRDVPVHPGTIGVGALAGLEGEVTIVDGTVLVARAEAGACRVAPADDDDAATILVVADVPSWTEHAVADCANYDELETALGRVVAAAGFDVGKPTPVRIRGEAEHAEFHVIDGACPHARPSGPAPWRDSGPLPTVDLVGIYVENAPGVWTHHERRSHLHVVAPGRMGHLDDVTLRDVVVSVPTR